MRVLGIDAGTTGLKAVLFETGDGRELGRGYVEYPLETPSSGIAEISPEVWYAALVSAVREALRSSGENRCEALAFSSQGESFVLLDERNRVLRKAIVWLDRRSSAECGELRDAFGRERIYHATGDPDLDTAWLGTKLLHLRKNEPETWKRIAHVLLVEDYLIWRLTGRFCGNGALWCSTLLYDLERRGYWRPMLDCLGLPEEALPEQVPSGVAVGKVLPEVARELGLRGEAGVVSGGMDQACGALGSGNIRAGTATDNTGTSFNLSATSDKPVFDAKFRLPCQLHVVRDAYLSVGWSPAGGVLLKYFRDNLFPEWASLEKAAGRDFYDALVAEAAASPAGANGVVMLPHLPGALCPEMDPSATAAVFGVRLESTRGDWARAMLESVACMTRANLELLRECGLPIRDLVLTGGASRSALWNQVKAGITGIASRTLAQNEAGCLGAAMLAALGMKEFASAEEAVSAMVAPGEEFPPPAEYRACAEKIYGRYRRLYQSLREMFKER